MSLLAIPPALLLLVPPFALYAIIAHPASHIARLIVALVALLSLLVAALGLAFAATSRLSLFRAAIVLAALLRFVLGAGVIYLINVALPRHLSKLQLYNTLLIIVLFCATVTSFVAPFLTHTNLPLVAAVLTLISSILPFSLFGLLLLSFGTPPNSSPPHSPHSEKSFQPNHDDSLALYFRSSNQDHSADTSIDRTEGGSTTSYTFLVCAQIAAILASALRISVPNPLLRNSVTDVNVSTAVIEIIHSVSTVVWILCVMSALIIYSRPAADSSMSSYFTPQPNRIVQSRSPQSRSYHPCPSRTRHTVVPTSVAAPPSAPSHLTEDFWNLRDPFAPPNVGVAVGATLGVSFTPDTAAVPRIVAPHTPPRSKSKSTLKTRPSSASQATRRSRRKISVSTRISAPAFALGSALTEDTDFDPEEAFLTQLLLQNLDAGVPVAGHCPTRSATRAPAVHRFTQDSTSTGRTLCESEAFRLPRGSLSTEVGSVCVSACAGTAGSTESPVCEVVCKAGASRRLGHVMNDEGVERRREKRSSNLEQKVFGSHRCSGPRVGATMVLFHFSSSPSLSSSIDVV